MNTKTKVCDRDKWGFPSRKVIAQTICDVTCDMRPHTYDDVIRALDLSYEQVKWIRYPTRQESVFRPKLRKVAQDLIEPDIISSPAKGIIQMTPRGRKIYNLLLK